MAEDKSKTVIVKARAKAFLTSQPEENDPLIVETVHKKTVSRPQKSSTSAAAIAAAIRKGEISEAGKSVSKGSEPDTKKATAVVVAKQEPIINRKNKLTEDGRVKKIPACKMAEPMKRPADDTLIIAGKVTAASKRIQTPVAAVASATVKAEEVKVVKSAAEPKKATAKPTAKPAVKKAEPKKAAAKPAAKPAVKKAEPKKATAKPTAKPAVKKAEPKKAAAKPTAKPAVKKAEPKKAAAKPTAKPVVKKAEPKKAVAKPTAKPVVKKAEPKKAAAKPTAKPVVKKAEPKKAAAKSAVKKAEPKKVAIVQNTYIQYQNESYKEADLVASAEKIWTKDMKRKAADLKSLELYVKPQERMVYCVFNKKETGSFAI